ncbi:hypothetical protein ALC53_05161, partial [Atta colombica]
VNFYSPKGYNYISTRGLGFILETLEILKQRYKAAGDKKLYACLTYNR